LLTTVKKPVTTMIEDADHQDSDGRSRALAELDKDPFSGGRRKRHGASLRPSLLRWFAGVVLVGAGLQTAVVLLDTADQPPRSFLAQLTPQGQILEIEMPSAGRNQLLSVAELRWCMREDIRIEILDTHGARSDAARFNGAANSYNRRCTHFRYREGDLAEARRDVDEARSSIVSEALAEAFALTAPAKDKLAAAGYSVLTKDVQELLRALGYAPGPIDGRYGARTRAAVESFERGRGWPVSGQISETLRKELLERVRSASASEAQLFEATAGERAVIRAACSGATGVAGYNRCVESRLQRLAEQRPPNTRVVTERESAAIEETCTRSRMLRGEAAYERCVAEQSADLAQLDEKPSLAAATDGERAAIEDGCRNIGFFYGPAAFYRCAQERLAELAEAGDRPELTVADAVPSGDHR
jgi:Putative peptidoglycan binding domain